MLELSILLLAVSLIAGIVVGAIAGLLPGVHVNNTSAILLGMTPMLVAMGVPALYVALTIVVSTVSQSFLDILPSIFLGAPDEATVMAVLPGHKMLLEGRGLEAVRLSAIGSGLAIPISLLMILPLSFFFKTFDRPIQAYMGFILLGISALVVLSNRGLGPFPGLSDRIKAIAFAASIFLICGLLGVVAFSIEPLLSPLVNVSEPTMLLPLLSGLFGAPALILSLNSESKIPLQYRTSISLSGEDVMKGAITGTAAGALVSWFPAVSTGVATTITGLFSKKSDWDEKRYLVSVSGVNTANAIFSLVALYVIMHPRSGAVAAAQTVLGGTIDFGTFMLFIVAICATGALSYVLTLAIGGSATSIFSKVNYQLLNRSVLAFLAMMCLALTGILGLITFAISAMVGMAPHILGVRKTCLMGVLLVPCIMYFM
jgi:putative membrane protein